MRWWLVVALGCVGACHSTVAGRVDDDDDDAQSDSDLPRDHGDSIEGGDDVIAPDEVDATGTPVFTTLPDYVLPEPQSRGSEYFPPGNSDVLQQFSVIGGWSLELSNGWGLEFGGLRPHEGEPRPPTRIKVDGVWTDIRDALRAANPLQSTHDALAATMRPFKTLTTKVRNVYFDGASDSAQASAMADTVAPSAAELRASLNGLRGTLADRVDSDQYVASQVAFVVQQLDSIVPALDGLATRPEVDKLLALRAARIQLELATEALDAEPPGRVFSQLAFDTTTGLFAMFGGDHYEYTSNDLWLFDMRTHRWKQRHPAISPEPRANHQLLASGNGTVVVRGGYIYGGASPGFSQGIFVDSGPGDWTYDIIANTWTGGEGTTSPRRYREVGYLPDAFPLGDRPNAAAHAAVLSAIATNTFVELDPPKRFAFHRDWGTVGHDAARDMLYWYNGGHASYSGSDVPHYHVKTNRWDQLVESELAAGHQASGESIPGWSFNERPWIPGHSWNGYNFDVQSGQLVAVGRQVLNYQKLDKFTYLYDPDLGDWSRRVATTVGFDAYGANVRFIPGFGLMSWNGSDIYRFDASQLTWALVDIDGTLPGTSTDHCGLVYDATRDRVLFFQGGSYNGTPYSGEVFALDLATLHVTSFTPAGSEYIDELTTSGANPDPAQVWVLREAVFHPASDMVLFASALGDSKATIALDIAGNRWVALDLPGQHSHDLSTGWTYDAARNLILLVDASAQVAALRFDGATATITTFAAAAGH